MMINMVLIKLVLLAYIVVMVVDISGFIDSLKSGLKWVLTGGKMNNSDYRLKPIDCSLCMTFWVGIIYLFITGLFSIKYLAFVLLLAVLSEVIKDTILLMKDTMITIINLIYKLIDR